MALKRAAKVRYSDRRINYQFLVLSLLESSRIRNYPLPLCNRCISSTKNLQRFKQNEQLNVQRIGIFRTLREKRYSFVVGLVFLYFGLSEIYRENVENIKDQDENNARILKDGVTDNANIIRKSEETRQGKPWQVQVMSTLPLKAISRTWGRFNELEIPYHLRVPGFKLYSSIFGVNLSEASESDLHAYPNLASFFYRSLKSGSRPLDTNPNSLLSPADGRVLQYGIIECGEVEQVKGVTYSLDTFLGGTSRPKSMLNFPLLSDITSSDKKKEALISSRENDGQDIVKQDEEFARVNGISYTLSNLLSGLQLQPAKKPEDASTTPKESSEAEVRADLARRNTSWYSKFTSENRANQTALYYIVIYLAPGDYHHFHSPCAWVVETRRHFAGELYSVSPYLQRIIPGVLTLNERVVLLGRWRWGFFSYIPVGATNVGSIKINFDRELQTNSLVTDTAADLEARKAAKFGQTYCGYSEAMYETASPILRGYPLRRGEEMGGFRLGSTVVLVFEAPKGKRPSFDEGWMGEKSKRKGGWKWVVERGQKIKMGQALGWVDES